MKYVGGIQLLDEQVRRVLQRQLAPQENVIYCVSRYSTGPTATDFLNNLNGAQYTWFNAVAALDHRLICLNQKTPIFIFRKISDFTVRSIEYLDIKTIETSKDSTVDAFVATILRYTMGTTGINLAVNGEFIYQLPLDAENELKTFVDWLREKVRQTRPSKEDFQNIHSSSSGLAGELEKLASLHQSGVLSNQEFEASKKKLLGL